MYSLDHHIHLKPLMNLLSRCLTERIVATKGARHMLLPFVIPCPYLSTLPRLPPHAPHPSSPPPHILPLHQQLDGVKPPSELLIALNPMHKRMARPAQPRHLPQLPLRVPAALQDPVVHLLGDQVVVRERDPAAGADLAPFCLFPRGGPDRRRGGDGGDIRCQRGGEEGGEGGGCW